MLIIVLLVLGTHEPLDNKLTSRYVIWYMRVYVCMCVSVRVCLYMFKCEHVCVYVCMHV